jgi:hypothetical protein
MIKSIAAKVGRMLLCLVVFMLSVIVGTALGAVLMKATEL